MKMQKIGSYRLGGISAQHTNEWINFTDEEKRTIEEFRVQNQGKYREGTIFGVVAIEKVRSGLFKKNLKIKYGNMLYSYFVASRMLQGIRMPPLAVPISVVITKDHYIVMGKMNSDTVSAGKIQFVGGALDKNDLDKEGNLSLDHNVKRETMEELAIKADQITSIQPRLLIHLPKVKNNVVIAYETKLNITKDQLIDQYKHAMNRRRIERSKLEQMGNEIPDELKEEFSELIFILLNKEGIRRFKQIPDEKRMYALPVLRFFYRQHRKKHLLNAIKDNITFSKPSWINRDFPER